MDTYSISKLRLECVCGSGGASGQCVVCQSADMLERQLSFDGWLSEGIRLGYCEAPICGAHDGTPYSKDETIAFEAGEDPCVYIVRVNI